ncbi:MAG: hypothetical protein ACE5K0_10855 [Candidatus Methanofastidiosia archaeon]
MNIQEIFSGLVVGFLFGFVLQRGRFCMNSSLRNFHCLFGNLYVCKRIATGPDVV